jgi:DNA mismatch repair protein MutS2
LAFDTITRGLAGQAATGLGKELAELLKPSTIFAEVQEWLEATDEAALALRLKGTVAPFGGIVSVRQPLMRSRVQGMLNPRELLDIAQTSSSSRRLKRWVQNVHADHSIPRIAEQAELLTEHRALEESIMRCIDESGAVADSASAKLAGIRREIRRNEAQIRTRLDSYVRSGGKMLQEALITMRGGRYVIPVKQEYRAHFGGIVHDQSGSGATLFVEPEPVVQMGNKLRELTSREQQEVERILQALTAEVSAEADDLLADLEILAWIDFTFAKAEYARHLHATKPLINDRGFIKLRKGRHPLIAAERVVPIDVRLGDKYTGIIVTGPNTGGKTVSLKTIGLLSVMAMCGLFVPAEEGSQLCMFDAIYADIGDEQSIEQNLSTFSSHMTNIIHIIKSMTPKSLVLLDELGAGTDPQEGSALAISILEYMHRFGCRIVATTHYSELKAYAYNRKGLINASMEFDVATLSPTYRLLIGVPGRSNALAIAERLGLPKAIIQLARGEVSDEDMRVDNMIAALEQDRLTAEQERDKARELRGEVERSKAKLAAEQDKFSASREKLLEKAQADAREIVTKARREADQVIADLRKLAQEEGASVKEHKLIDARHKLDQALPEEDRLGRGRRSHRAGTGARTQQRTAYKIGVGDEVNVLSLGKRGIVLEIEPHGEALVQLGIMKMKVAPEDMALHQSQVAQQESRAQLVKTGTKVQRTREGNAKMELDLRGQNLDDAILETDRFLDEAFLANMSTVFIIHGKGTGVLRQGITDFLRRHKHVKSYRLGEFGEGGTGVTVATLN